MTVPSVYLLRAGLTKYAQSLQLQRYIAEKYTKDTDLIFKNVLILTEHHPVYTIGIRTKDYTINDEQHLRALGAEFYKTNRGGLITFHGPGQLVAYPIINLKDFEPSIRWYVCHLEKTIIDMCKQLNLDAKTTPDTGVWIDNRKICALGVHCKRYITTHGLALNCNIDLKWFDHIVPCGLVGKGVTSITKELHRPFSIDDAIPLFLNTFRKTFNCNLVDISTDETNDILNNACKNQNNIV